MSIFLSEKKQIAQVPLSQYNIRLVPPRPIQLYRCRRRSQQISYQYSLLQKNRSFFHYKHFFKKKKTL